MITEDQKDLLIRYINGPTNDSVAIEVHELLKNNVDAVKFYNEYKSIDIALNESFLTSAYREYSDSIDKKIDALIANVNNEQSSVNNEQSSNNFLNMLFLNKLSPLTLSGYALTAFLFFGIGTYIDFSDDSLSGFNSTILEKDLLLFRSSSSEILEQQVMALLEDMLVAKSQKATGKIGSNPYKLSIISKSEVIEGNICYGLHLESGNINSKYIVCHSNEYQSILQVN